MDVLQHINKLFCSKTLCVVNAPRLNNGVRKLSLILLILGCFSGKIYAQKIQTSIDSLKVSIPYAIGQKNDNVYIYSVKNRDNHTLINKFKIDPKEKSIVELDSLTIQNAFLRYIGANRENLLYLSLLPTTSEKQIIINNHKISVGDMSKGLNILYVLDASNYNVVDSINYVGNNMELATTNNLHGLIFNTNCGVGIVNKLGYYPRVNQFDGRKMEDDDIKIEDNNFIYHIYFKSGKNYRYLPIPKNIVEDLFNQNNKKEYHSLSYDTPIFFLNEDKSNLYFTYNLEILYPNSKDPLTIENNTVVPTILRGERKFCQLFSLNKENGDLSKIFQFEYQQPVRVNIVDNVISFSPISNIQQLKIDGENLIFSISGVMDSKELQMLNDNTLFTSVVWVDKGDKKFRIQNMPYSTKQFVDLYNIENTDIVSKINFAEYDNVENMKPIFNSNRVLLFHKRSINSSHNIMIRFK